MMAVLLSFLFISFHSWAAPVLVTETVGQVADHIVTSREVQMAMVVEGVLFPSKLRTQKSLYEVRPEQPEFRAAITQVLLESVVALEAENFNVSTLSGEEINQALQQVEKAVAGKVYWNQLEGTSAELRKLVTRKLMAKSFLSFKTSSMAGIITDQEAQEYYGKNRAKFGSTSFESFKENIKNYLAQQQLEERIRAWFEVIKRKYKVRSFSVE